MHVYMYVQCMHVCLLYFHVIIQRQPKLQKSYLKNAPKFHQSLGEICKNMFISQSNKIFKDLMI